MAKLSPWRWYVLAVVALVLGLSHLTRGIRAEHLAAAVIYVGCAWIGPRATRFSFLMAPFALAGFIYDQFHAFDRWKGRVHVDDLWRAEHALFGNLGETISSATHPVLDAITGFAYVAYIFAVLAAAGALYFRDQKQMARVAWAFLLANVLGWTIWILYPAAPPWYVDAYGLGPARLDVHASAAGAARFDALVGYPVFERFYARSVNVFGAMPSLHVAFPAVAFFASWPAGRAFRAWTGGFTLVVAYSAVYLRHHYVLDVLAGLAVSALATVLVVGGERLGVIVLRRRTHAASASGAASDAREAA